MRSIIESSLQRRFFVVVIAAAVAFVGMTQLRAMPVDVLPEFTPPYVEVQTEALGLSADEVEQLITVPLEADLLNGVPGVDVIRSKSVAGLSSIVLVFDNETDDLLDARQLVQERLTQAHALPNVSKPPEMLQPMSSANRVMMISLSSTKLSLIQQSVLTRWTIRPRLLGVPGVANVVVWGQRERQLQVQVDPERLRKQGVSMSQIIATAGNAQFVSPLSFLEASTPGTGGFIESANQRLGIRHIPIATADDLARVPIEETGDRVLRLGDVASVVEDHQPLIGDAVVDEGPGLMLVVEKTPESNALAVTRDVEEALAELRPGLSGVQLDSTIFRPATFIDMAIDNVTWALLIGALLVVLVLVAFLFEWRVALISLVSIPLSLLAALLVLSIRGATLNVLLLAGLLVAAIVVIDDVVVDVESIHRRLREQRRAGSDRPTAAIVLEASLEVRRPIVYATLVALLAVVPVFFLDDLSGSFLRPLAVSYMLAVAASLLVALTVTPALSSLLLSRASSQRRESPLRERMERGYGSALSRLVRSPRPVLVAAGVALVAGLATVPLLDGSGRPSLLPSFKERDLLVHFDGAPGASLPATNRIVTRATQELKSLPGVRNVGAHLGRAVTSDQVVGISSAELWISVDPDADYDATVSSIQEIVSGYPGLTGVVRSQSDDRVRIMEALSDRQDADVLTGAREDLVVRVYGQELDVLSRQAEQVQQALRGIDGVVNPRVELQAAEPTLEVEVDLAAAREIGVKPGDVRRAATSLLSGIDVGSLFEEQKVFDVVVRGIPETRQSLTSVRELLLDTPGGGHVRLGDVAEVRITPTPTIIRRDAVSRRLDVSADVEGRDLDAVIADVENRVREVEFPLEYHAEVLGDLAEQQAAQTRLLLFGIAAAVGIFLLLQAAFGSWRVASLLFLTLPLAVVGGLLAALGVGGEVTIGTLVGLLGLLALAARNGILLIDRFRRLEEQQGEASGAELVLQGARDRLAPIAMTTLATGLALAPFAIAGDIPGFEIVHPMAVVVLGGLVTLLLVNLFVVPALYLRFAFGHARRSATEPIDQSAGLQGV